MSVMASKRVGLIACEIFFREIAYFAARSAEVLDVTFLPKGLHDLGGEKMRVIIQAEIDRMNEKDYDRILLGYGLCNNGIVGLLTKRVPLVIPKAHDCITLFLGSRQKYQQYFKANVGTYFHTSGWLERGKVDDQNLAPQMGLQQSLEDYIAKYGEEDGEYLWEILNPIKNYRKVAYINLPLADLPDLRSRSRQIAEERNWEWEELTGEPALMARLLNGPYDDDFLIVQPGHKVVASHDHDVVSVAQLSGS